MDASIPREILNSKSLQQKRMSYLTEYSKNHSSKQKPPFGGCLRKDYRFGHRYFARRRSQSSATPPR